MKALCLFPIWGGWGSFLCILHALPDSLWVSPGNSGFLPQSKYMRSVQIGDATLPVGVNTFICVSPLQQTGNLSRVFLHFSSNGCWGKWFKE